MTIAMMTCEDGQLHGTEEEKKAQLENLLGFGMHNYYDSLAECMFPTVFVDVSREQAQAWRMFCFQDSELESPAKETFRSLVAAVDAAIGQIRQQCRNAKAKVFVKLSSRSPKDAVWNDHERTVPILKHNIKKMKHKSDPNEKMIALRRSFLKAAAVSSAAEAFDLMKWSSRVISDLRIFLTESEGRDWFDIKVVVRQFMDDLDIADEFRGFVHNGKLTALSQYQTECYFPNLVAHSGEIAATIQRFFNDELLPKLPDWAREGAVIDFAVIGHKVFVVELNPFTTCSGACLFDWEKDHDVLFGTREFEIRVVKEPLDHMEARFAPWADLIAYGEGKKKLKKKH